MTNTDKANSEWWMNDYCRKHREWMFMNRKFAEEIRNKAKQDGVILPEGWGSRWCDDVSEDWWMDDRCQAIRDLMFTIRNGDGGGEELDKFLQKWHLDKEQSND